MVLLSRDWNALIHQITRIQDGKLVRTSIKKGSTVFKLVSVIDVFFYNTLILINNLNTNMSFVFPSIVVDWMKFINKSDIKGRCNMLL